MIAARRCFATLAMLGVLSAAACAPSAPPVVVAAPVVQASPGRVVSMRLLPISPVTGGDIRGAVLAALGGPKTQTAAAERVEFIVQLDRVPQAISVVQDNPDNLSPGDRVLLTRGDRPSIARAGG
jgi:hypothetical protein